jgi:dephospho-CoA kinase
LKRVIALTGMPGSRKSLFAEKLVQLGYDHIMLSQYLKQRLQGQGLSLKPIEYWQESLAIRTELGSDILAKLAWEDISNSPSQYVVVDGIRCLQEACYLQQRADQFLLVSVQASPDTRRKRLLTSPNAQGFYASEENRIAQLDAHELKLGVGSVIAVSDVIIFHDDANEEMLRTFMFDQAKRLHTIFPSETTIEVFNAESTRQTSDRHYLQALSKFV